MSDRLADLALEAIAAIELNIPLDDDGAVRVIEYLSFMVDQLDSADKELLLEASRRKSGSEEDAQRRHFFGNFADAFGLEEDD